jgi:hypothetical protein
MLSECRWWMLDLRRHMAFYSSGKREYRPRLGIHVHLPGLAVLSLQCLSRCNTLRSWNVRRFEQRDPEVRGIPQNQLIQLHH